MASHAAAHGCGSAFVRRMIRVGTGWRLHALVAESGRRASLRCWWSARAVPVQVRASAQCLQLQGRAPCRCGAVVAHHLAKVRVASSNLVICSHAVVTQQVEHDTPIARVAGSKPVNRSLAVLAQMAEAPRSGRG